MVYIGVSSITAIVASAFLAVVLWNVVKNVFFHPLHRVPGPFLAKTSSYYMILVDLGGNKTSTIHSLHEKFGPVVRIGPNDVSFSEPSVIKELYGQGTPYLKTEWYEYMMVPPIGVFGLRGRREHAARRKLLSHAFSQAAIQDAESSIRVLVSKLTHRIKQKSDHSIDMLQEFRRLSLDIVGELFLGQSFGALESKELPEYFKLMDYLFISLGIGYAFPVLKKILPYLPLAQARYMITAPDKIIDYGAQAYYRYIEEHGREAKRKDLLTKIISANAKAEEGQAVLTDEETYLEVGNLIFAGTAKTPLWQNKLRAELRSQCGASDVPQYKVISDLPVLDAIVRESLRLYPAAPASLPREVPAEGRELDSYFMPGGTTVSVQCYTTHRDPLAFPDPLLFKPERWLEQTGNQTRANELFMPFSKGSRACLGQNLAMMELKLAAAAVILRFKVGLAASTTEESMRMIDHFLALPKAGKCELTFEACSWLPDTMKD